MVSSRAASDARRFEAIVDEGGDMRAILIAGLLLISGLPGMTRLTAAADAALAKFFGTYAGTINQAPNDPLMPRDLATKINPYGEDAFTLERTTAIYPVEDPERQSHTL